MVFKPSFWLTLVFLVPAIIFYLLGAWQLDRQKEKEALLSTIEQAPALSIEQALSEGKEFARVSAYGRYDPKRHILLDNRMFAGRAGVHAITPFTLADGTVILVNRGWLPMAADRRNLPAVVTENGPLTITGRLVGISTDGVRVGQPDRLENERWPQLVTYLEPQAIEQALNSELADWLIQLDPADPTGFDDRHWKMVVMEPAVHGAYAFQWFSMLAATVVLWIFLGVRRARKSTK